MSYCTVNVSVYSSIDILCIPYFFLWVFHEHVSITHSEGMHGTFYLWSFLLFFFGCLPSLASTSSSFCLSAQAQGLKLYLIKFLQCISPEKRCGNHQSDWLIMVQIYEIKYTYVFEFGCFVIAFLPLQFYAGLRLPQKVLELEEKICLVDCVCNTCGY